MTLLQPKTQQNGVSYFELSAARNVTVKIEMGRLAVAQLRKFLLSHPDTDDLRLHFNLTFSITQTEGSYLYGPELQFQGYGKDPTLSIEPRVHRQNGYTRIEMNVPVNDGLEILHRALENIQSPKGTGKSRQTFSESTGFS